MAEGIHNRPVLAAVLMLSAMSIVGFVDNFVAVIAKDVSLWQFHVMRSVFMAPLLIAMSCFGLGRLMPRRWAPVIARSLVITMSMMLYFGSLGFMPISQALAGMFTSPIFVLLINTIVLRQKIGPWRILAVAIGFAGILLVLQPGAAGFGPAMLMPVAAGFFYAVAAIATRRWCAGESATSLLAANMVMLGATGAVVANLVGVVIPEGQEFMTRLWTWDIAPVLPWVILQAVGSVIGVFMIIRAYQLDEPTNVAVFEYSVMVFAPFFAWVLFGQLLGVWQGFGVALIALAGVIIAIRSN